MKALQSKYQKEEENSRLNQTTKIPLICRNDWNYRFAPEYKIYHNL